MALGPERIALHDGGPGRVEARIVEPTDLSARTFYAIELGRTALRVESGAEFAGPSVFVEAPAGSRTRIVERT